MTRNILLRKLRLERASFISAEDLKRYCVSLGADYDSSVNYLIARKHLVRIFKGIFYLRSLDEIELGSSRYNHLELLSKGMEMKGIKEWYFGMHTALKLNNMTHESFNLDDVMSASIFRAKPISMAGHRFKFYKVSKKILGFGVIEKSKIRYSDPEKTILDFAYIWKYEGISDAKISDGLSDWASGISRQNLRNI